ncbi:MAG: hypothetical protein MJ201_03825 [Mycoplasmoidaceae bacterium]|nr:hypothetical protein [Mycoplasmoidaceae bacterium]
MVFRPTSTVDMIVALETAFKSKETPVTIVTSRSPFNQVNVDFQLACKGAYAVRTDKNYKITLYATGSELPLALEVANRLERPCRVVAINSLELLMTQDKKYIDEIFDDSKKISIEYGATAP